MAPINNHAPGQGRGATHGVALHRVSIACHAGEQGGWGDCVCHILYAYKSWTRAHNVEYICIQKKKHICINIYAYIDLCIHKNT